MSSVTWTWLPLSSAAFLNTSSLSLNSSKVTRTGLEQIPSIVASLSASYLHPATSGPVSILPTDVITRSLFSISCFLKILAT